MATATQVFLRSKEGGSRHHRGIQNTLVHWQLRIETPTPAPASNALEDGRQSRRWGQEAIVAAVHR